MVINDQLLLEMRPIRDMCGKKHSGPGGTSYGLGEAGYDIRIKQEIRFTTHGINGTRHPAGCTVTVDGWGTEGRFTLASAMEEFDMPSNLTGIVHDKSTWARRGLSVFNTVIEPGWKGFLTLELVYHGDGELIIPAGAGIAQVVFHETAVRRTYEGKYNHQPDHPVGPIDSV